jgi:ATP phosphoribosyltransferase
MIKLGVPSKGRLMEETFSWFASRSVHLERTGSERDYSGYVKGIQGVELVLLSASEIPTELNEGRIHFGVTGSDLVCEKLPAWDHNLDSIKSLGFGFANLVLSVPKFWIDVDTLDDFDSAAEAFRDKHGFRLRIATKYHYLVREFLKSAGVADYQLVDSQGATEGTVKNETAEAIADITSTGETLKANHLKILDDGLIHSSEATLFKSMSAFRGEKKNAAESTFLARILSD